MTVLPEPRLARDRMTTRAISTNNGVSMKTPSDLVVVRAGDGTTATSAERDMRAAQVVGIAMSMRSSGFSTSSSQKVMGIFAIPVITKLTSPPTIAVVAGPEPL